MYTYTFTGRGFLFLFYDNLKTLNEERSWSYFVLPIISSSVINPNYHVNTKILIPRRHSLIIPPPNNKDTSSLRELKIQSGTQILGRKDSSRGRKEQWKVPYPPFE